MRFIIIVLTLFLGFSVVGQNPTNYQYRAVRERSIAQMLDSSFHFPRYNATPSGLRVGSSANSGAGAIDTINHVGFFYSGDKWRAFGSQGFETRLVNGGKVTWDSLLVFSVAPAIYYINGAYYTSSQTYLTLDAANGALDRIDLIYLDSTGAHKETGVAAATPEEPSLPANSIRLTAILIPATATVPGGGVDTVTIYDENVEWTVSTTSLTAPSTDNTSPFHFITDIQTGAITNASILKFTATSAIDVSSFTALRFYIKLKGTFSPSTYLTVYFVRSGVKICIPIEIKNGTYGFTRTNTTSYQQITIPISDFGFTSTAADGLWFQPSGSNSSGFYMDWVQLQGGISQPVPSNTYTANLPIRITNNVISADTSRALAPSLATNWYLKFKTDSLAALKLNITDTSNKWITSVYRRSDSVFYVKGGTEYFAYKDSTGGGSTPTLQQVLTAGSTLTQNNTIVNGTNTLSITSTGTGSNLKATNSSSGTSIEGTNSGSGIGIYANLSGSGTGLAFLAQSGDNATPIQTQTSGGTNNNKTNIDLIRTSSSPSAGIATSIDFSLSYDPDFYSLANRISSRFSTVSGTPTSELDIFGKESGTLKTYMNIQTAGTVRVNNNADTLATKAYARKYGFGTQGDDIASVAGAISLGAYDKVFEITGTNAITLISNVGRINGAEITLIFTSTATLVDGTANSGTDIGMELEGNTNFVATADDVVTLILCEIGGVQRWRMKGKSIN